MDTNQKSRSKYYFHYQVNGQWKLGCIAIAGQTIDERNEKAWAQIPTLKEKYPFFIQFGWGGKPKGNDNHG